MHHHHPVSTRPAYARRRRLVLIAASVASAIIGVTACGAESSVRLDSFGLPINRPVTRAELLSHPESTLYYAGSVVVQTIGSDELATSDAEPDPAYAGAILTAAATPTQLYAWYATHLAAGGYLPVTYYPMSDQPSGRAWRASKSHEQVQVSVFDRTKLAAQQHIIADVPPDGVIYEVVLVGYRFTTH